ncbi:MAG: hypothetical protein QNJ55_29970 [Xenococcus sp. MO_188.B8]|nr:hypothetical protein [Xenococcus sp. MO_188.B8]
MRPSTGSHRFLDQRDLFFNDLGRGIVLNISFDEVGNISELEEFVNDTDKVVQIVQGPDDNLYFVKLFNGVVGRCEFEIPVNELV